MKSKGPSDTTPKVSKLGQRRQVVLPKAICDQFYIKEGDYLAFWVADGTIMLKPKKLVDADDLLTEDEGKEVTQGERQLQQGKYTSWNNAKKKLKL